MNVAGPTSFRRILVANRGEIALRVMRSARACGFGTVAVYSSADAHSRHVHEADMAVCIGGPLPAESYLNIPALIEAARLADADAIHPGYGFLAENENFAQACCDAGLVFIGPSAEAILAMGNKAGAKQLMLEAGVPCIPGYQGSDQGEERLAAEAQAIGYPVMIKATAGGGGRGMRLVASPHDFLGSLRSAQSEARNAFGDATVILERAIQQPRHIEIQVFADRHGNAIHLGERDCSVQRRHQKLIEEAPSPAVSPELRERMGATAVAAVKAIRYEGAGTLEFLLDSEGAFYFMEMNTRLQVEHPVTEAVTGLDLVEMQLRVACGEPLVLRQEDVRFSGHAIEARLCAEDADKSFMPQSGVMALWQPTRLLRVEHALESGAEIPPYYDSMIAKLVSHGATRSEARGKLIRGLQDTVALGVTTNQVFLTSCLTHPVFAQGGATTAFIGQYQEELLQREEGGGRGAALAALLLVETATGAKHPADGRRLSHSLASGLRFEINGVTVTVALTQQSGRRHHAVIAGRQHDVELVELGARSARFICDGLMETASYQRDGAQLLISLRGRPFKVLDTTLAASTRKGGGAPGDRKLRASMSGRVVAVLVVAGDRVTAGQPMVTLEAMKMEHVHAAATAGVVIAVHVAVGEQVSSGRVIVELESQTVPVQSAATG